MYRNAVCLVAMLLLAVQVTEAQHRPRRNRDRAKPPPRAVNAPVEFGVHGGYDFDADAALAGAQVRVPLAHQLYVVPSGSVFFDDAPTEWQLNADLVIRPAGLGGLYAGGGVAFADRSPAEGAEDDSETRVGYNLFAGLDGRTLGSAAVRPFAEARWTGLDDYDPFRVWIGFNVPVTGGVFR